MKKPISLVVVLAFVGVTASGQGTTFISSLDQPSVGTLPIGSDAWVAASFTTGNSPYGYSLESIQLLMSAATGNPAGFTLTLYNSVSLQSANIIGTLNGSDPLGAGVFSFTPNADLSLAASTVYWFSVTSDTSISEGAYHWNYFNPPGPIFENGWTISRGYQGSSDGVNWGRDGHTLQFSITASVIPEPSALTLLVCGGALVAAYRRRPRQDV